MILAALVFVGPAPADVSSLAVGAQTGTLTVGTAGSVTYEVTAYRSCTWHTDLNCSSYWYFDVTGLPPGATHDPINVAAWGTEETQRTFTLTITTSATTPAGQYALTVKADDSYSFSSPATYPATLTVDSNFGGTACATFGSASSGTNGTAATAKSSLTLTKPAGTAAGDVLLADVTVKGGTTTTVATPSGWHLIGAPARDQYGARLATFWRAVTTADDSITAYTFNFTSTGSDALMASGGILRYSGLDTSNPIDTFAGNTNVGYFPVAPSLATVSTTNETILAVFGVDARGFGALSPPYDMTERLETNNSADWVAPDTEIAEGVLQNTGPTGSLTLGSTSGNGYTWAAQTIALNCGTGTAPAAEPVVGSVNSTSPDGAYKAGAVIPITVGFSEPVTVSGSPQLTLETGATDRTAGYASGSGTDTLTFDYTVQNGDTSADLDYISTDALALNSGTIKQTASPNTDAILTLPKPGTASSLAANKAIVIDTTAPTLSLTKLNGSTVSFPYTTSQSITSLGGACTTGDGDVSVSVSSPAPVTESTACTSGAWALTLSTAVSSEGDHTLSASQTDAAGNIGNSGSKTVTIDKTAPTVSITAVNGSTVSFPYSTSESITSLGGACTSGDGNVSVTLGGNPTAPATAVCSSDAWTLTLTTPISDAGSYTFAASQTDAAGNTGGSGDKVVTITAIPANNPPTAASQTVTTNYNTAKTITLGGTDANGDTLTFSIVSGPSHGTLGAIGTPVCSGSPSSCTADVVYTPTSGYSGSDSFTFTTNDSQVDSSNGTVSITVNAAPPSDVLTAHDGAAISASEGQALKITLGTFSDSNTATGASAFAASINWGDGTSGSATVTGRRGDFTVTGSHTFTPGTYDVVTTITAASANTVEIHTTVTVVGASLKAGTVKVTVDRGTTNATVVATFTDSNPLATDPSAYSATINWGDGNTTSGTVASAGRGFSVTGSHTYTTSGTYTLTITITHGDGLVMTGTARVR